MQVWDSCTIIKKNMVNIQNYIMWSFRKQNITDLCTFLCETYFIKSAKIAFK
jgi:hypothetical protein